MFETLWLNLTVYDGSEQPIACDEDDAPAWERGEQVIHSDSEEPRGYLDYLTWQTRTLRLHPEGDAATPIGRRVSFSQGRRFRPTSTLFDPMFAYQRKDASEPFFALRFNEYRDLWWESAALYQMSDLARTTTCLSTLADAELASILPRSARYVVSVSGLCVNAKQAGDVLFWRHETLPLPLAYLDDPAPVESLKFALKMAEEVASNALRKAAWAVVANRLTGDAGMNPDKDRVQSLLKSFAPQPLYWSRLERPYRELLVALADAGTASARTALVAGWFDNTLRPTALDAFDRSVGRIDAGRDLKATTVGRGLLLLWLGSIRKSSNLPARPESQEDVA